MSKHLLIAFFCTFLAIPAFADDHSAHGSMDHSMATKSEPVTGHYAPAMDKMHKDMMVEPTGDADIDFVKGMIPHHQGAIDMAKILKEKGKDPELQKLADGIIAAQEKEIAFMKDWLAKHEKPAAKTE